MTMYTGASNLEQEDEYEIERPREGGATVYQCFISYRWIEQCEGYDEEGFPKGFTCHVEVEGVEVGGWWEIDEQGHDTGAEWQGELGQPWPSLLPPMTEEERKKFEDDMVDKAEAAAELRYERMLER